MLQHNDPETWTDEVISKLLGQIDGNSDGSIQFTEFWSWIGGHGQNGSHLVKDKLLVHAIAEDKVRFEEAQERDLKRAEAEAEKERQIIRQAEKAEEREAGERVTQAEFIAARTEIGVNRSVAASMFAKGDED